MPTNKYIIVYDEQGNIAGKISTNDILNQNCLPTPKQYINTNLPQQRIEQLPQQPIIIYTQAATPTVDYGYPKQPDCNQANNAHQYDAHNELLKFFIALLKFMFIFSFIIVLFLWVYFVFIS